MLRFLRYFSACFRVLRDLPFRLGQTDPGLRHLTLERIRGNPRYQDGKCLTLSGYKVFSQFDGTKRICPDSTAIIAGSASGVARTNH